MKTWIPLILAAASLAFADETNTPEAVAASVAHEVKILDAALLPVVAIPPVFDRNLRAAAIGIEGRVEEVIPMGKIAGKAGSFVAIKHFRLATGEEGDRAYIVKVFVQGLLKLAPGTEFSATIYPCGATSVKSRQYALTAPLAYRIVSDRLANYGAAQPYSIQTVINADRVAWIGSGATAAK
jgi:hypothetical protein